MHLPAMMGLMVEDMQQRELQSCSISAGLLMVR